jgi:hypothetical protein
MRGAWTDRTPYALRDTPGVRTPFASIGGKLRGPSRNRTSLRRFGVDGLPRRQPRYRHEHPAPVRRTRTDQVRVLDFIPASPVAAWRMRVTIPRGLSCKDWLQPSGSPLVVPISRTPLVTRLTSSFVGHLGFEPRISPPQTERVSASLMPDAAWVTEGIRIPACRVTIDCASTTLRSPWFGDQDSNLGESGQSRSSFR